MTIQTLNRSATRSRALSAGLVGVVGIVAGLFGGCADYNKQIGDEVRSDPTPELQTLWQRPVDVDNRLSLVRNTNFRAMWEDLGRAMLLDRPSMATLEPMPR